MVQAILNADLNASKMAIVQTPSQSYAVEYLPRYGLSQEHAASSTSAGDSGQATQSSKHELIGLLELDSHPWRQA